MALVKRVDRYGQLREVSEEYLARWPEDFPTEEDTTEPPSGEDD